MKKQLSFSLETDARELSVSGKVAQHCKLDEMEREALDRDEGAMVQANCCWTISTGPSDVLPAEMALEDDAMVARVRGGELLVVFGSFSRPAANNVRK